MIDIKYINDIKKIIKLDRRLIFKDVKKLKKF